MDTTAIAATGLVGLIMSFFTIWAIYYVLCLVSRWKVLEKAGLAGWKSLIPIYSDYCTYKIAWKTSWFWIFLAAGFVSGLISNRTAAYTDAGDPVPALLSILATVVGLALTVIPLITNIKLANRFGHGVLFGLGLNFLAPVFYLILGLGDSEYLGNPEENMPPRTYRYRY